MHAHTNIQTHTTSLGLEMPILNIFAFKKALTKTMDERTDSSLSWGILQPTLGGGQNQRSDGHRGTEVGSENVFGQVRHYSSRNPQIQKSL